MGRNPVDMRTASGSTGRHLAERLIHFGQVAERRDGIMLKAKSGETKLRSEARRNPTTKR
jgi:hypothetical protein